MIPSFTGLSYFFSFIIMALLSNRFFLYFKKEKSYPARMFFYPFGFMALFCLVTAIGGIFFPTNPAFLRSVVIIAIFFQTLAYACWGSLVVYLKFPKIPPWYGFLLVFLLGAIAMIFNLISSFQPYLMGSNWINWDFQSQLLSSIFRGLSMFISCLPLGIIFIRQGLSLKESYARKRGLGIGVIMLLFSLAGMPFLMIGEASALGDAGMTFMSLLIFGVTIFTQRPPKRET